ncbi:MAG: hypothetical protein H6841_04085 [Planctomycetes bacterium]|nr:hypothetical protein [Planctomycetota bacterium]
MDAGDFPEEVLKPGEFSIELSPRFTEHLCKALVVGDLAQIASKFHKLADNLTRKAMGGDPRDELDLRFSALACREVADRLLAEPAGDPTREIESARKAYRRGDFTAAAAQYKQCRHAPAGPRRAGDRREGQPARAPGQRVPELQQPAAAGGRQGIKREHPGGRLG